MHIDSYQFGRIVIDGTAYTSDCLIIGGKVTDNWRRKQGHSLSAEDLSEVFSAAPSVLVVGCGASGLMHVPEATRQTVKREGIKMEILDTERAIKKFNELASEGADVAAAFHLTC